MKRYCFLFTKKFPYSVQEAYLEDELVYLKKKFEKIIIIPFDEYIYNDEDLKHRSNLEDIEVIKINNQFINFSVMEKIKREWRVWKIFMEDFWYSREKVQYIRSWRVLLGQLRHLYKIASALKDIIAGRKYPSDSILFYNYWLHKGSVICAMYNYFFSEHKIMNISRAHSVDLFHKDWNNMIQSKLNYIFLPFEYFKVKNTDYIYPISNLGLIHFKNLFPKFKDKFRLAHLGILNSSAFNEIKFRNNDIKILLTCSSIDHNKRVYLMPQIIAKCAKDVKWYHIGSGEQKYINEVLREIEKYNVSERCVLLGRLSNQEVRAFYTMNKVYLFLNLSIIEGIPVSLMEAASYGVPMIATHTGGNSEIVDEANGFLISKDFQVENIIDIINSLSANYSLWLEKSKNAYLTFKEKFDAEKNYMIFADEICNI